MHSLWSNSGSTNPFLFQTFFPPSVSVNSGLFIDEIIYSYLPPSHPTQENMLYKLALAQQPLTHIILKSKNPSPLPTNVEFHSFTSNLLIILLISNICTCVTPPPKKKTTHPNNTPPLPHRHVIPPNFTGLTSGSWSIFILKV